MLVSGSIYFVKRVFLRMDLKRSLMFKLIMIVGIVFMIKCGMIVCFWKNSLMICCW